MYLVCYILQGRSSNLQAHLITNLKHGLNNNIYQKIENKLNIKNSKHISIISIKNSKNLRDID